MSELRIRCGGGSDGLGNMRTGESYRDKLHGQCVSWGVVMVAWAMCVCELGSRHGGVGNVFWHIPRRNLDDQETFSHNGAKQISIAFRDGLEVAKEETNLKQYLLSSTHIFPHRHPNDDLTAHAYTTKSPQLVVALIAHDTRRRLPNSRNIDHATRDDSPTSRTQHGPRTATNSTKLAQHSAPPPATTPQTPQHNIAHAHRHDSPNSAQHIAPRHSHTTPQLSHTFPIDTYHDHIAEDALELRVHLYFHNSLCGRTYHCKWDFSSLIKSSTSFLLAREHYLDHSKAHRAMPFESLMVNGK
ncbi:hypothetical protein HNY73_017175 [Argiope bruennichi]|uniref:Uncharacterized protein n=1 Tax=Argiope bruennichi TaxID=94029 RepID=A0A8T0EQ25_ARGBR|nr:hypothetical protein HNY73_017175 [Argiope bruennichi]